MFTTNTTADDLTIMQLSSRNQSWESSTLMEKLFTIRLRDNCSGKLLDVCVASHFPLRHYLFGTLSAFLPKHKVDTRKNFLSSHRLSANLAILGHKVITIMGLVKPAYSSYHYSYDYYYHYYICYYCSIRLHWSSLITAKRNTNEFQRALA